jgi:hypothetical protein
MKYRIVKKADQYQVQKRSKTFFGNYVWETIGQELPGFDGSYYVYWHSSLKNAEDFLDRLLKKEKVEKERDEAIPEVVKEIE